MTYTKEDCKRDTLKHSEEVGGNINKIIEHLIQRRVFHDASKLEEPELSVFTEFTPKLNTTTYGSDEYKRNTKKMKVALVHHYAENRHHPEFHAGGIFGMNLVDIVEMFCDWLAATTRHDDGCIYRTIELNKKGLDGQLKEIFENTAREIFKQIPLKGE